MKAQKKWMHAALIAVLASTAASCTNDEQVNPDSMLKESSKATIYVSAGEKTGTRVAYDDDNVGEGKNALTWQAGDLLTVVRMNNGAYVNKATDYAYEGEDGATSGSFSGTEISDAGNGWHVYYPNTVTVNESDGSATLSMEGQQQNGDANTAHLKNNLLLADKNVADLKDGINLEMQNSIMKFSLTGVPAGVGKLTNLLWAVETETGIRSVILGFTSESVVFSADKNDLTAYLAFIPEDMKVKAGGKFSVMLIGEEIYKAETTITGGKEYQGGNRYTAEIDGSSIQWAETQSMKFTVKVSDSSLGFNIPFPTSGTTPVDLIVDWGDNNAPAVVLANTALSNNDAFNHTYTQAGEYVITIISGQNDPTHTQIPVFNFGDNRKDNTNTSKLISIGTPLLSMAEASGDVALPIGIFYECSSLTTIPQGLFDRNTRNMNFAACFRDCTSLTSIPEGLFTKCTEVWNFEQCFYNCESLTSIPTGLFDENTKVTAFNNCFYGCSQLTEIPAGLFNNNAEVNTFAECFSACSSLENIPEGLFDANTEVGSFSGCFNGCAQLTSIPEGLFDANTAAYSFSACFNGCTELANVPEGLFDKNIAAEDFMECFSNCFYLILNKKIFSSNENKNRFSGKDMIFASCFQNIGGGDAPELWLYETGGNEWLLDDCFIAANALNNWNQIPQSWGGPAAD